VDRISGGAISNTVLPQTSDKRVQLRNFVEGIHQNSTAFQEVIHALFNSLRASCRVKHGFDPGGHGDGIGSFAFRVLDATLCLNVR
jgi:hypothetical protein